MDVSLLARLLWRRGVWIFTLESENLFKTPFCAQTEYTRSVALPRLLSQTDFGLRHVATDAASIQARCSFDTGHWWSVVGGRCYSLFEYDRLARIVWHSGARARGSTV
jgi:hypothetical protein